MGTPGYPCDHDAVSVVVLLQSLVHRDLDVVEVAKDWDDVGKVASGKPTRVENVTPGVGTKSLNKLGRISSPLTDLGD
jgi:hypothetical protein